MGGNTRDEVNTRTIPGFWTSQRPQPADPGTRDRIGGLVRSKRAQPIAALVTKVLDDEPTMAEIGLNTLSIRSFFRGRNSQLFLAPFIFLFLILFFNSFRIGKCNRISENYGQVHTKSMY